jgi:hypothetical protein
MTAGQLWAGVDVGKEHHWVAVIDDTGAVVLSRKLVNDEHQIRDLVREVDRLGEQVSWTVDLFDGAGRCRQVGALSVGSAGMAGLGDLPRR